MKDLFGKCGFNCGRCAAYKENALTDEDRQRGSDGWKKYYGFRIRLDRMYCDGCQTPDEENPVLLAPSCTIRKCAIINGVETCAHCSGFQACMYDLQIFNPDIDREKIAARMGAPIPEGDYLAFIEPYEHLKHLNKIRTSLDPDDIVEAKVAAVKPKIVDFPDDLPFPKKQTSAFRDLHRVLSSIISINGDTYAQQALLKKRKEWMLKLLWAFGLFGELKEEGDAHLIIDSESFFAQKITSQWSKVKLHFDILKESGVHCEVIPVAKDWLLPSGWIRDKRARDKVVPWYMKMSFDDNAGGASALRALKRYTARLNEKYSNRAFRYFKKADMRVLMEGVK